VILTLRSGKIFNSSSCLSGRSEPMRYALKFGYLGENFKGYARQPNLRTVEGDILNAFKKTKIIEDEKSANFQSASRTDKGVSAIGNVLAIDSEFRKDEIIGALNAHLDEIWFYGISLVDDGFNPRYAKQRWYRYYLLDSKFDEKRIQDTANIFIGSHNFSNFVKLEEGKDPEKIIDSIDIFRENDFIILDFKAQSFLWNMVRRIVKVLVDCAEKKISEKEIRDALIKGTKVDFGIAAPEPLILMDVTYEIDVERIKMMNIKEKLEKNLQKLRIDSLIYNQMLRVLDG
jgi:tRNA pseudouridine38-40 synthase